MLRIFRGWIDRYFSDEEAVLLVVLIIASLAILLTMGMVLAPMIASIIIAFLLQGVVVRLRSWGAPHWLAVSVAFVILVAMLVSVLFILLPVIWQQSVRFIAEMPRMIGEWQDVLLLLPENYPNLVTQTQVEELMAVTTAELGRLGQGIVSFSVSSLPMLVAVLVYFVLVPILVFFFLKDSSLIVDWVGSFLPRKRPVMSKIWQEMNQQIANYVRGKAIEILIVGSVTYMVFALLGVNYAALLAIAVGLSVLIPYIGAAVVTLPVAMIGFFQWGWGSEFFYLLLAYGIIQALDGNVLVPLLFSEAVNLHPIAIIMAVLVFGGLWGFWGVFFAIPLATLVKAILYAWPIGVHEAGLRQKSSQTDAL
ncbi:AI-2E family transporter [Gilvimarinus agarilyticus]|uniref:AI-2E family transporter n=1 Tax=unclassified Gilvimarinus TaxID=2642066 RepID=UPI001C098CDF|nr:MULTISPECIES: AI-2E family transporter [unclassified Gilvimarinus]MBU2887338.1 AI-2E family transporter [Gilvimarinus agarilyticus]MDO6571997.1 AI-2E family transporter [Gilvimarinus sp. 2_MG-2023]MDO6746065.1 AI-2E family transporter [Gilvimarinus sp. 1_MG-2023]